MRQLFLICIFTFISLGQSSASKAGAFTRMSQNAHHAALGNAGVALNANSSSFYYNPSSVTFSTKKSIVGVNIQYLSLDRRLYSIGFHKPTKKRIQLSLGWIHATVNELYEYSSEAEKGEKLNFGMNAFYGSFGLKITERIAVSFTSKYIYESLNEYYKNDYKATGISFDISSLFKITEQTQLGIVLRDIGGSLTTNSDKVFEESRETAIERSDDIPSYIVAGIKSSELTDYFGLHKFIQTMDLRIFDDKRTSIHIGTEFNGLKNGSIRMGYDTNHLNIGLGIHLKLFKHDAKLDYAYISSFYDEGGSHIFSWSMDINK